MRTLLILLTSVSLTVAAHAQDQSGYVSTARRIVGTHQPASRDHSPAAMAGAANRFLESLSPEQKTAFLERAQDRGFLRRLLWPRRPSNQRNRQ